MLRELDRQYDGRKTSLLSCMLTLLHFPSSQTHIVLLEHRHEHAKYEGKCQQPFHHSPSCRRDLERWSIANRSQEDTL